MAEAGIADRVTIKLQDYRDERGRYDAVASIEMFEAVGKEYWQTYFDTVAACLAPGGRAGIQAITIDEAYFSDYIREIDFIRAYIFPGGMLPTPTHMRDLPRNSGLVVENDMGFGQDYARTLHAWADRFTETWGSLTPLGFDERFRRMWLYYLFYCEAGFRTGGIDVRQMVYRRA
jgi:cyclopropane-fatty-acyl-phospholipid synthase